MASTSTPSDEAPPSSISVLFVGGDDWRSSVFSEDADDVLVTGASRGRDGYRWLTTQPGRIDCVVCTATLPDITGVSLLEAVRAAYPDLPFVLLAADGDETLASRAIDAGVTGYVPIERPPAADDRERIGRTVRSAVADYRATRARHRQARQFDARFEDPETFMWVLAPDGTVRRTNGTAIDNLGSDDRPLDDDRPFWELPWWRHSDTSGERIRAGIRDALDGTVVRFETHLYTETGDPVPLDVTIRPATDETGATVSLVVEGVDVGERTELERELRESEELHRVTLNNMTDTVLVTDDEGEFTYVCPNVHFIFGYSVDEIHEMGTIDALLGEDLFDPDDLEATGVLTNVECTATDKAGNEHTLLVNVREVSIQGGTTLFSCRDITKRKERERALTALHRTSRDVLYAETETEIARQIADDATSILDVPGGAVFLFDSEENVLRPTAVSEEFATLNGPVPTLGPQEPSVVGRAFVEQSATVYDDVHRSDHLANPATDVRSAIVIPLGDHGVMVVGTDECGAFDEVAEEVADLLAATAEAALDRVEREVKLRERDRELQHQNRQLTRLNRTNTIIREIDQSMVRADSREEIEHAVCDRLTASDRFEFAWIGERDPGTGRIRPGAWAGTDSGYLDAIDLDPGTEATEPAVRTLDSGDPTVVVNVGEDLRAGEWRKAALSRGYQSVASVPIAYDDYSYGVLTVYAGRPDAFDEMARTVLKELGETVASAVRAVGRKDALLSDTVTELEYRITDRACLLSSLAAVAECSLEVKGGVHQTNEGARMLVAVDGAPVDRLLAATNDMVSVEGVRRVVSTDDGGVVRLTVTAPFVAARVADAGAAMQSFEATPDGATVTVDVPRSVEIHEVDDVVSETYPGSELVAQRERDQSVMTRRQFRAEFLDAVTDRQLEVVQTAYYSGYFESPRHNSGRDIADTLDISASAFYDHTRKVQRKLFSTLFEAVSAGGG